MSKYKINNGHNIVVVSIATAFVITSTYFLQIQPALLHQIEGSWNRGGKFSPIFPHQTLCFFHSNLQYMNKKRLQF